MIAKTVQPRNPWLIMSLLIIIELVATYETAMIYAALPKLTRAFGDPQSVSWVVTGYLLTSAAFAVLFSRLGDLVGRARVLVLVLAITLLGSLLSSVSTSLAWLVIGRAAQGAAGAILPLSFGLAKELLPRRLVAIGVGFVAGTASLGVAVGLILGGLIVDHFSWHYIFYTSALLSLIAMLIVIAFFPIQKPEKTVAGNGIDWVGGVLFVVGVATLLFCATRATDWGLLSGRTVGLFSIALISLAAWLVHELRHPMPLINVRLLGKRQIVLANLIMAFTALSAFQVTQLLTTILQQPKWTLAGLGLTATAAAFVKLPANAGGLLAGLGSGTVSNRFGSKAAAIIGSVLVSLGWLLLAINHESVGFITAATVLAGLGVSGLYAAISNIVVAAAPLERVSEATGLTTVVRLSFHAIGSQILVALLSVSKVSSPDGTASFPSLHAYNIAFATIAVATLVPVILSFALRQTDNAILPDFEPVEGLSDRDGMSVLRNRA